MGISYPKRVGRQGEACELALYSYQHVARAVVPRIGDCGVKVDWMRGIYRGDVATIDRTYVVGEGSLLVLRKIKERAKRELR